MQLPFWQQPVQELGSQAQLPPTQWVPSSQAVPPSPQLQDPLTQLSPIPPSRQSMHCVPPSPQAPGVGTPLHRMSEQQPAQRIGPQVEQC